MEEESWCDVDQRFEYQFLSPEGVLPYMGFIGLCSPREYVFSSRFGIEFGYFALELGMNIALWS